MDLPYTKTEQPLDPNDLIIPSKDLYSDDVTILTGQNLIRGALLGKVTASSKYVLSLSAAGDGSEVPVAVLARDTDATAADVGSPVYKAGGFAKQRMTIGTGHTFDSVKDDLAARGIFLYDAVPN